MIVLEGPASIAEFTAVLRTLVYRYTRMASLIERQPNVGDR